MGAPRRKGAIGPALAALLAFTSALALGAAEAAARQLAVRGAELNRFGRIALEFERPTKVDVRVSNNVLILTFSEAVNLRGERLAAEMPAYVSVVRRDPDGTGLRLALATPYRPNVLEAGEKVFVDLLPESWTGLPPSLPPEVVDELARRAQAAEARLEAEAVRRRTAEPEPVGVQVVPLPTATRLVFSPPGIVPVTFRTEPGLAELRFTGHLKLDGSDARAPLAQAGGRIESQAGEGALLVRVALPPGRTARGFREDETFIVDIEGGEAQKPAAKPAANPAGANPVVAKPEPADAVKAAGPRTEAGGVRAPEAKADQPGPAPVKPAASGPEPVRNAGAPAVEARAAPPAAAPAGPIRPETAVAEGTVSVAFPFRARTAAALYEAAGIVTAVFHTAEAIDLPPVGPAAQPTIQAQEALRQGAFAVVRFTLSKPQIARLAPAGEGWVVSIGETAPASTQALSAARAVDAAGRTIVAVPLTGTSGVHWLDQPSGERIAVVTAFGAPRGLPKAHRYAEFRLLPSAHGLAVAAEADDVIVQADFDRVVISRNAGLAVSLPEIARAPGGRAFAPALQREAWSRDRAGDVLRRWRDHMHQIAAAPRAARPGARLDLARFLLANRMEIEAAGVLAAAIEEEPSLGREPHPAILQVMAAVRSGRDAEAARMLKAPHLVEDPEGVLWRAVIEARAKQWPLALTGLRRSAGLIDAYPDDLQVWLRLLAARAAIEMRDFGYAEGELKAVGQLRPDVVPRGEIDLLQARLDEALGKTDLAAGAFRRLAEGAERPVAAEATLRWVDLAAREGTMEGEERLARLETLAAVWRGDDLEVEAVQRLGRLYAEGGRWRDAFTTARRASRHFGDHPGVRALHDETARLFADFFLSGRGDTLPKVEALALFFDFREFMPIGRRGDEIVRQLADRLVELDLLDEAGSLLEHQVKNRVSGAARATVAARLATVRLMDGQPALALKAIQSTRLPELPAAMKRARLLLEARALADLSRTDLALEVLADEAGPEVDRLRADILWSGRRWREAGEAHEGMLGTAWQTREPLDPAQRIDVLRAAIAFAVSEEPLALERLRGKFGAKMADSADARTFAVLVAPGATQTREFRDVARSVTSADMLADFLREYRKRYPDAAAAPRPARPALATDEPATTAASGRS